jgi:predicted NUDIX family phosphoesterase
MAKCLVVKRKILEKTHFWQRLPRVDGKICGMVKLSPGEIKEFLKIVEENKEFFKNWGAEGIEDKPEWQQIIFYGLIRQGEKFFVYQRGGEDSKYKEQRLQLKISAGVGGHIEPFDTSLIDSLYRETDEEVEFWKSGKEINLRDSPELAEVKILGILKDDTNEVGAVHLGLVCEVNLRDPEVEIKIRGDQENIEGRMMRIKEYQDWVKRGLATPETWTEILTEYLSPKRYKKSL